MRLNLKILFVALIGLVFLQGCGNLNRTLSGKLVKEKSIFTDRNSLYFSEGAVGIDLLGTNKSLGAVGGEAATEFLRSLDLSWSSTGLVTYAPGPCMLWYERGFISIGNSLIIVGNYSESSIDQKARISPIQRQLIFKGLGLTSY